MQTHDYDEILPREIQDPILKEAALSSIEMLHNIRLVSRRYHAIVTLIQDEDATAAMDEDRRSNDEDSFLMQIIKMQVHHVKHDCLHSVHNASEDGIFPHTTIWRLCGSSPPDSHCNDRLDMKIMKQRCSARVLAPGHLQKGITTTFARGCFVSCWTVNSSSPAHVMIPSKRLTSNYDDDLIHEPVYRMIMEQFGHRHR